MTDPRSHHATARAHVATRLWILLGNYPALFPLYIRLKDRLTGGRLSIEALYRNATEIVIEGFPRSANTFALVAFQRAQTRRRVIAHHLHAASQVLNAVRAGTPVLLLVREPLAAVASLLIRCPELSVREGLWYYSRFHRRVGESLSGCVVASHASVTEDYGRVIRVVNDRFGTPFDVPPMDEKFTQGCFRQIAELGKRRGTGAVFDMTVAMPNAARTAKKKAVEAVLVSPRHAARLRQAREEYEKILSKAV